MAYTWGVRRIAGFLYDHRWWAVAGWLIILIGLSGLSRAVGPSYAFDVNLDSSESVKALNLLADHDPMSKGARLTIAWQSRDGVDAPATKSAVAALLTDVAAIDGVDAVVSPDASPQAAATQVSADRSVAFATVITDDAHPSDDTVRAIVSRVEEADAQDNGLTIGVTGSPIKQATPTETSSAEALGFVIAAVILLIAFGSILAAALPIATALVALGAGLSVVQVMTHVLSIPSFAPQMVSLISIGVGIDYALFVVSRHRTGLMRGMEVRDSVIHAFDTSGRAVIFAGITVLISILGMVATGIGFLTGMAVATSVGVLFTMLVTITLLPALLNIFGRHVLGRRAQRELREQGPHDDERSTRWGAWAQMIQRRPWPFIAAAVVLLLVLCIPAASLRLGMGDAGSEPAGTTSRIAFDLVSDGFGPGANGPLLLISEDRPALESSLPGIAKRGDVASVSPVIASADGKVFYASVVPTGGPQDAETSDLISGLRDDAAATGSPVMVSGVTAAYDDFAAELQSRLPWFLVGVLTLSSLLLMLAFRSLAIPLKAAAMNLLAAGASFGVLVAVAQWGWLGSLLGFERTGPIDAFIPILLLAVLFGLSMDYQVFLVARMREEWVRTHDNAKAVTLGLSETGRVITAAAMIMIAVFASFVTGSERVIKIMGLGLAVAIFLDAFVIRSLLVPALMRVLGNWNWWLPRWLDRLLPHVTIEPEDSGGV